MRDLRAKLQAQYKLVGVSEPVWLTAWSIPLPPASALAGGGSAEDGGGDLRPSSTVAMLRGLLPPLLALLALLAIDASDWLGVLGDVFRALPSADPNLLDVATGVNTASVPTDAVRISPAEAALAVALYMLRHALLYFALERWAFEWDARWWAVESDDV